MVGTRDGCSGRERGIEGLEERGLFHGGGLFSLGLFMRRGVGPHHRTWCGGCGVRGDVGWGSFARGGEVELDWGSWVG